MFVCRFESIDVRAKSQCVENSRKSLQRFTVGLDASYILIYLHRTGNTINNPCVPLTTYIYHLRYYRGYIKNITIKIDLNVKILDQ